MTVLRRLVGAVMLGVATLFQPKARPDAHWSESPSLVVHAEAGSDASGGPPR